MNSKIKKIGLGILTAIIMILTAGVVSAQPGPMVTFRFDDGLIGQYNYAKPILSKYNFPATDYIFTDPPQAGDWLEYMNWNQIEELHNIYGWEIGSHTKSHPNLTTLSDNALINELSDSKTILESHGFTAKSFASPFGSYDNRTLSFIARFYESHTSTGPYDFNTFPFNDYGISVQEVRNSTSVATVKNWIDEAVTSKKWLVLLFHEIVNSNPTEYQYSKDNFESVVDYVKAKNIPVTTITEALKISNPNLVLNPSFEVLTGGWADNWLRTDSLHLSIDINNNGSLSYPKNSLKLIGSAAKSNAYTKDFISINPSKEYLLKLYFNCQNFTSGGVDVFIDEYDSQGRWLNWKWQTGIWSKYVGYRTATYAPSPNATKLLIWMQAVSGSNLTCYVDNVIFTDASGETNKNPVLTMNIPNQSFDEDTTLKNAFDLDNYFSDPDGDFLTYSYSGATNVIVNINPDGTVNFSALANWTGQEEITFVASDGSLTAQDAITVTVNPVNPGLNLVLNPSFESTTLDWADNWLRTDATNISIDTQNNGSSPNPKNSLKLLGNAAKSSAYTKDSISISPSKTYPLKVYFNCQNFTSGSVDVFIDEYDSAGKWLSWKWQTGIWSNFVGNKAVTYTPSQNAVKILIWIESASGSNLTCYIDNVILRESLSTVFTISTSLIRSE